MPWSRRTCRRTRSWAACRRGSSGCGGRRGGCVTRSRDTRQQRQRLLGWAPGLGVVDGQHLSRAPRDRERLVVELELSHLWMDETLGAVGLLPHVVAGPERAGALALERQLADQVGQVRVVEVGS